jgi:glutathione S-transferase
VGLVANELGLSPELIHFDVHDRTTSNGQSFTEANPLAYVPVLELDNDASDRLTETIVVTSYLADQQPEAGLITAAGTLERAKFDQILVYLATEIAQKHIPLMRKLLTAEGTEWTRNKLVKAYTELDRRLPVDAMTGGKVRRSQRLGPNPATRTHADPLQPAWCIGPANKRPIGDSGKNVTVLV